MLEFFKKRSLNFGRKQIEAGIVPETDVNDKLSEMRDVSIPKLFGTVDVNLFSCRVMY